MVYAYVLLFLLPNLFSSYVKPPIYVGEVTVSIPQHSTGYTNQDLYNILNRICGRLSAKLVPTFADRVCRVVSATDPHGRKSRFSRPGAAAFAFK
jgi:hypothetical protein